MIDKRQNLIFSFSLTNYSYPVFTEYETPPRKPPISFFFHNKFIRNKIKGKSKKEIKWKIRLPSKCISFFAYFYTFWSYPSDTTTVVKWAHLCENLGGLRGSSHVSHVASRGFLQAFETGRKLAGSCQVIKIALYECHDLLTQNGNRKIVAGGEQIGIPWRTVGESFGAISHWTLSLFFRPFICLKTRILWSCHVNVSLLFLLSGHSKNKRAPINFATTRNSYWKFGKTWHFHFASVVKCKKWLRETNLVRFFGIIETFLNTFIAQFLGNLMIYLNGVERSLSSLWFLCV